MNVQQCNLIWCLLQFSLITGDQTSLLKQLWKPSVYICYSLKSKYQQDSLKIKSSIQAQAWWERKKTPLSHWSATADSLWRGCCSLHVNQPLPLSLQMHELSVTERGLLQRLCSVAQRKFWLQQGFPKSFLLPHPQQHQSCKNSTSCIMLVTSGGGGLFLKPQSTWNNENIGFQCGVLWLKLIKSSL